VFDVADLGLAESALHAPATTYGGVEFYPELVTKPAMVKFAGSEVDPAEFEDWIRRQLH
jgi:hypothetical protein